MVHIYTQENIIGKCHDCKKILKDNEGSYCKHCSILNKKRVAKLRECTKGILCITCFHPISIESNGNYLSCINCRHMRDLRRL